MKLSSLFIVGVIICLLCTCQEKHNEADMKTNIDSLSYAVGHLNGSELKEHLTDYGIEEEYLNEVVKGIREGLEASGDMKQTAYYFGVLQGLSIMENTNGRIFREDSSKQLSPTIFMDGVFDGMNSNNKLSTDNIQAFVEKHIGKIEHEYNLKKYDKHKRQNEQFIADIQKAEGIGKLPNGVFYRVIYGGVGDIPTDSATIVYHEEVSTTDKQLVSSTFGTTNPLVNNIRDVAPSIRPAIARMKNGATWEIYVPWKLVDIKKGKEDLKPFSALVYKIHVISIKKNNNKQPKQIEQ